jgi:iron complex transport system substrate-binding protein
MRGLPAKIGQCKNATKCTNAPGSLSTVVCAVMPVIAWAVISIVAWEVMPVAAWEVMPVAAWEVMPVAARKDLQARHVRAQVAQGTAARSPANGGDEPKPSGSPRRIVSLVPSTTEMLFVMGAGARVVGVSSYDHYPAEVNRIPHLGGLLDPSVERILSLKPDLAIVYDTQAELRQQLGRAGIAIFPYAHRGLPDITETMRALGERVGLKDAADAAASRIEQQLGEVRTLVAGRPRPRTLLVFGRESGTLRNVEASGGYGFLHDLLVIAGGTDVLADIPRQSVQMSTEMILVRAPDVVIELHYATALRADQLAAERRVWSALPSLPAVRDGRIYVLVGDEFVVPGPRIVTAARRLAGTLHP